MNDQNTNDQNGTPNNGAPQQNGYPQNGTTQQIIYVQQQVQPQQPATASAGAKDALFTSTASIWMLIASIVATVNLVVGFINSLLGGLVDTILNILIVVGMWLSYVYGRKRQLSTTGVQLIRVPYIIRFVFLVISFVFNIVIWIFTFNVLTFLAGVITFIFECILFSSIMKTANVVRRINSDKSVLGMKAGKFAGIVMIITAAITFIRVLANYFQAQALLGIANGVAGEAGAEIPAWVQTLVSSLLGGSVMSIVAGAVALIASISGAIVLLQFAKRLDEAND